MAEAPGDEAEYIKGQIYVICGVEKKYDGRQMRRLCSLNGCQKLAVGKRMKCKAHGGGKRCVYAGCSNSAVDNMHCKRHGGGKRCSAEGCPKSAVGSTELCKLHGGGKRCQVKDCKNSAVSRSLCIRHGGGPRCRKPGCTKGARSPHQYCYAHGGGRRCNWLNCNRPANKSGYCSKCSRAAALRSELQCNDTPHSSSTDNKTQAPLNEHVTFQMPQMYFGSPGVYNMSPITGTKRSNTTMEQTQPLNSFVTAVHYVPQHILTQMNIGTPVDTYNTGIQQLYGSTNMNPSYGSIPMYFSPTQ